MADTYLYFQIKSAPIKLRYALQGIGFLTPLEIEHAILRTGGMEKTVMTLLQHEGYNVEEIERAIRTATTTGIIIYKKAKFLIRPDRRDLARRYLVLDIVANNGIKPEINKLNGYLLIPGFGLFYGLELDAVVENAIKVAPSLRKDWSDPKVISKDLRWLIEKGYVKMG